MPANDPAVPIARHHRPVLASGPVLASDETDREMRGDRKATVRDAARTTLPVHVGGRA
jgi:hypothetical protein